MDAYDIFKKLTKGLKFKTPATTVKTFEKCPASFQAQEEIIKVKKEERTEDDVESLPGDESEHSRSGTASQSSEEDNEMQLLEGVKVGKKRRKKKQKEQSDDLKKKLEIEEQNHFRNEYGIRAVGRHIPAALRDFSELSSRYNVSDKLVDVVRQCGYSEPTPVQRQTIPCMLEGRQVVACAPTGSGKTAAFLVPLLHSLGAAQGGPRALVLCPTRELAAQIHREALRLSAASDLRCSLVRKMHESKVGEREATIRKSDIVISTPNRLCYLLNQDKVNINLDKVRWLVIDEADKLFEGSESQEGDFRQQIERVLAACGARERRVAMYSATHTPALAKWSRRHLRGLINVTVGQRNAATSTVQQELLYCGNESGKLIAFRQLVQKGLNPPVLVFVQSKDRAKQLFKELIYDGINVDVIHADRTQAQRDNVVRSFRVGRVWVLICTELMGRGIDFRGVNLVLNYDFPPSAIAYIHRIGRAGRAGQPGRAVTFFTQDDVANLRSIASVLQRSGCAVPEYMLRLRKDAARRRRLTQRAPRRDNISTVLSKRKLEDSKDAANKEDSKADTTKVKDGKNKKLRKVNTDFQKNSNSNTDRPGFKNKEKPGKMKAKLNKKKTNPENKGKKNIKKKKSFVSKKVKNVGR